MSEIVSPPRALRFAMTDQQLRRLVERSQQGDQEATLGLLERLQPLIRKALRGVDAPDPGTAEDLRQEAIYAALKACKTYQPARAAFTTWAYRLIVQTVQRAGQKCRLWAEVESLDHFGEADIELEIIDTATPTPEEAMLAQIDPCPCRDIEDFAEYFRAYCHWEDLERIAERCGVQRATVESWYRGTRSPRHIDDLHDIAAVIRRPFPELLRWYRRRPGRENEPLPGDTT